MEEGHFANKCPSFFCLLHTISRSNSKSGRNKTQGLGSARSLQLENQRNSFTRQGRTSITLAQG